MSAPWPSVSITTDSGERKEAVAPFIISASRATDIPAFYGEWLLRRLDAGYVRRTNPFSGRPEYVSFENSPFFVFWSKNPEPFMPLAGELDRRNLGYCFHVTVNDYGIEGLEKGVPPLARRLRAFKRLADLIGKERVLWRFDPLLLTDALRPEELLLRFRRVGDELAGHTGRVTVSFITLYGKVVRNLERAGIRLRAWDPAARSAVLRGIGASAREWGMDAFSCADENDYRRFGIAPGKCIDGALIARLAGNRGPVAEFLRRGGGKRDRGQRPHCGCTVSKDIGAYNTCGHRCVYCYANASPQSATRNLRRHAAGADSIL
jgi:DNA repair photolyase